MQLRISAEADILAKNLADKFCQNVQIDTLAANDVVEPVTAGQDVLPLPLPCSTTSFEYTNAKIPGLFAIIITIALTIDQGLIALEKNGDEPGY